MDKNHGIKTRIQATVFFLGWIAACSQAPVSKKLAALSAVDTKAAKSKNSTSSTETADPTVLPEGALTSALAGVGKELATEVAARIKDEDALKQTLKELSEKLETTRKTMTDKLVLLDRQDIALQDGLDQVRLGLSDSLSKNLVKTKSDLSTEFQVNLNLRDEALMQSMQLGLTALDTAVTAARKQAVADLEARLRQELASQAELNTEVAKLNNVISDLKNALTTKVVALEAAQALAEATYQKKVDIALIIARLAAVETSLSVLISNFTAADLTTIKNDINVPFGLQAAQASLDALKIQLYGANGTSGKIGAINASIGAINAKIATMSVVSAHEVDLISQAIVDWGLAMDAIMTKYQVPVLGATLAMTATPGSDATKLIELSAEFQATVLAYQKQIEVAISEAKLKSNASMSTAITTIEQSFVTKTGQVNTAYRPRIQILAELAKNELDHMKTTLDLHESFRLAQLAQNNLFLDQADLAGYATTAQLGGYTTTAAQLAQISSLRTELTGAIDQAKQGVIDHSNGIVAFLGKDVATRFEGLTRRLLDLRIKQEGLALEHKAKVEDIVQKSSPALATFALTATQAETLEEQRRQASYALAGVATAINDLKQHMIVRWNPKNTDVYQATFKTEVMDGYASDYTKCWIDPNATMRNAMGQFAHELLATVITDSLVRGTLTGVTTVTNLADKLLLDKTGIELLSIEGLLQGQFPSVAASDCKTKIVTWAHATLKSTNAANTLWSVLVEEAMASGAASKPMNIVTLKDRVKAALLQGANAWKTYKDAVKALVPASDPFFFNTAYSGTGVMPQAELAVIIWDSMFTQGTIVANEVQFDRMLKNVSTMITSMDVNSDGVVQNTEGIITLKAGYDAKIAALNAQMTALAASVQTATTAATVAANLDVANTQVKKLAGLVGLFAQRMAPSYDDILSGSLNVITALTPPEKNVTAVEFDVKPFISDIQMFWSDYLYKSVNDNVLYDVSGVKVVDATTGANINPTAVESALKNDYSTCYSSYKVLNATTTAQDNVTLYDQNINYGSVSAFYPLNYGAGSTTANVTGSQCWIDISNAALTQFQTQVREHVIFRVFGSMELVVLAPTGHTDTNRYRYVYNLTGNNLNNNELATSLVSTPVSPTYKNSDNPYFPASETNTTWMALKAWGEPGVFSAARPVGGWNQTINGAKVGVYDISAPKAIISTTGTAYATNAVSFYPVRASKASPFVYKVGTYTTYNFNLSVTPLVLDFSSKGPVYTTDADRDPVYFDLNGDGIKDRTGWVRAFDGSILALDHNRNGKIESGSELFGEATKKDGKTFEHGFLALKAYDANKDQVIDAKDPVFKNLVAWSDQNFNGSSEAGELKNLAELGVTRIGLNYEETAKANGKWEFNNGNRLRYMAKFYGPASCPKEGCNIFDVYFGAVHSVVAGK